LTSRRTTRQRRTRGTSRAMTRQAKKGREGQLRSLLLPPRATPDAPPEMELFKKRKLTGSRLRSWTNLCHWNEEEVQAAKDQLLVHTPKLIDPIGVPFGRAWLSRPAVKFLPLPDASTVAHMMIPVGFPAFSEFHSNLPSHPGATSPWVSESWWASLPRSAKRA